MIVFDAFSGIGGFRLAIEGCQSFRDARFAGATDSDPICKRVYQRAFGTKERFIDDVFDIGTDERDGIDLGRVDFITAGFPCQPFANVGKKDGLNDPRAATFWHLVDILRTYQPTWALLENVQKLTSFDRGATFSAIVAALSEAGYDVEPLDLCASAFGVPQQRRRIYFACVRRTRRKERRVKPILRKHRPRFLTTWHLLENMMPREHIVPKKTGATVFRRNVRWEGDLHIDRAIARPICATMGKWHRANQDNYFSAAYVFGPPPSPRHRGREYANGEPVRRITQLEGLRLQGFPDDFGRLLADVAPTNAYRLIGNAVAVPVARSVVEWLTELS